MRECGRAVREVDGVIIALAHFAAIEPWQLGDFRQFRLRLWKDFDIVETMKTPYHLTAQLDVRDLIQAHRDPVGFIHDDVSRLE